MTIYGAIAFIAVPVAVATIIIVAQAMRNTSYIVREEQAKHPKPHRVH